MKKTPANLVRLAMLFAVALVVSNVVTAKTVDTHIPFLTSTLSFPGAVFCYAVTFLATDVVGELWGKKEAQTIVWTGLVCQVLACLIIVLTGLLPAADAGVQDAYDVLLGQNAIFVTASLCGYALSQSADVAIFHRVRAWALSKFGEGRKMRWLWNNVSTMTAQALDTVVFIAIAFGVGSGWLFDPSMWPTLAGMMVGQYLVKLALAALDTPLFWLLTREKS